MGVVFGMTNYEALVLACLNDPDDEGPRLILADWLDERDGSGWRLRYSGHWLLPPQQGYPWQWPYRGPQDLAWKPRVGNAYRLGPLTSIIMCTACQNPGPAMVMARCRTNDHWRCERCYLEQMGIPFRPFRLIRWEEMTPELNASLHPDLAPFAVGSECLEWWLAVASGPMASTTPAWMEVLSDGSFVLTSTHNMYGQVRDRPRHWLGMPERRFRLARTTWLSLEADGIVLPTDIRLIPHPAAMVR